MVGVEELRLLGDAGALFSRAQAKRVGYRPADLARLVRCGSITHVHQGWYAVGSPGHKRSDMALQGSG